MNVARQSHQLRKRLERKYFRKALKRRAGNDQLVPKTSYFDQFEVSKNETNYTSRRHSHAT